MVDSLAAEFKLVGAIRAGDFTGLPISQTSTAVNLTGSWKFFRPHLAERSAPCREACPLHNPIAEITALLRAGRELEALARLRQNNPLPAVTGRVCPGFCRAACSWAENDVALRIGDLERRLGDLGLETPWPEVVPSRKTRIAIVGAGPAGLGAAFVLAREGFRVTLFEQAARPGGLLRTAIPAYRLPTEIITRELENLFTAFPGIELECNHRLSPEEITRLQPEFAAVIVAVGLEHSRLPQAWRWQPRVFGALELLSRIKDGAEISGRSFAVVGGGNAAFDVARSLLRLGKEVEILYRRSWAEMPAYEDEKSAAREEGLVVQTEVLVGEFKELDDGLELSLHRARPAAGGLEPGDFLAVKRVDFLVAAIGQEPADGFVSGADDELLWAGDCLSGAATVVEALASGRRAALEVCSRLGVEVAGLPETGTSVVAASLAAVAEKFPLAYCTTPPRAVPFELEPGVRVTGFAEIRAPLDLAAAREEAGRCLGCGSCSACGLCWYFCPEVAIALAPADAGERPRVLFDYDHCKGCGQCAALCPRGVITMVEDE